MNSRSSGFSLVETLMVLVVVGIGSSVAVIQMRTTIAALDADKAANTIVGQLNYARQVAVNDRRNVVVGFYGTNEIKVTRQELPSGSTVMSDLTLPSGYTFGRPTGVVDTPDSYGYGTAVYLGGGTSGTFLGDGTFVDNSSLLLNGSIFTIGSGNGSARAITLSGSTGRVKLYWFKSGAWVVE